MAGYKTITDIHFGDWGMPLALIIAYIEDKNIDIETLSSDDLEEIYPNASSLSKENEEFYSKALNISNPALTSSTGSADKETLIVSPIPCIKSLPIPIEDFILPVSSPPASVIPRCKG